MSSTALKIFTAVTAALALLLALVGYRVSRQYAENSEKAAREAKLPQTLAVVARRELAAYKPIDKDAVVLAPLTVAPKDYFTNLDDVIGRVPLVDIDSGAPVTGRYFKEGNAVARIIPPGHQALSLEVNDVIAVGGFVRPGDVVDVLVYLRSGSGVTETQARVLLPAARVLAYEERVIDRPQGLKAEEGGGDNRRRLRTVVLAVPDADTTRVMLGASLGDVRLALRSPGEAEAATPAADKIVTAAELAQLKAGAGKPKAEAEQRPKVTVYRGSEEKTVTP